MPPHRTNDHQPGLLQKLEPGCSPCPDRAPGRDRRRAACSRRLRQPLAHHRHPGRFRVARIGSVTIRLAASRTTAPVAMSTSCGSATMGLSRPNIVSATAARRMGPQAGGTSTPEFRGRGLCSSPGSGTVRRTGSSRLTLAAGIRPRS